MGEALFNELLRQIPMRPITVQFHDGTGSRFSKANRTITLSNTGDASHLFHEMLHAVQDTQLSVADWNNSAMNREIEAFFAHYLYARSQAWFQPGNFWHDFFRIRYAGQSIANLVHYVGNRGRILGHVTNERLHQTIRYNTPYAAGLEQQLRTISAAYRAMSFNDQRRGDQNFTNLQRISQNCP